MTSNKVELCKCGHTRYRHLDTLAEGHGACVMCDCKKFMWVESKMKNIPCDWCGELTDGTLEYVTWNKQFNVCGYCMNLAVNDEWDKLHKRCGLDEGESLIH